MTQAQNKLLKELNKEKVHIKVYDGGVYELTNSKMGFSRETYEAVIATGLLVKMGRFWVLEKKKAERKGVA